MPHYDINYHPVNILDLTRLWRCFPDEDLAGIIDEAIKAVSDSSILELWAESRPRHFSVVVWVDALYQLCTLKQDASYRRLLAEGIMMIVDTGLGFPPSLFGADSEAVKMADRVPSPSPSDPQLHVANLSCNGRSEILVINATDSERELSWEGNNIPEVSWITADGQPIPAENSSLRIQACQWIWGRQV